jgi:SAM-dependent methyltransferase
MKKIGLNVGSGQRPFTSTEDVQWINVDAVDNPEYRIDLVCDGAHLPFEDCSIDYFVLCQVLEHFGCGEGTGLIQEAWRVLKPGGRLILSVPNLRALAIRWLEGGLSTQIYVTNLYGAYVGNEESRHKWGYDPEYLQAFLETTVPWKTIAHSAQYGNEIPGTDLPHDFWILEAECKK